MGDRFHGSEPSTSLWNVLKLKVKVNVGSNVLIMHVINSLPSDGAEMMLYNLLSRMNKERFNSVVVSLMDRGVLGDRIEALGIPVYTLDMKQGKPTPAAFWRLVNLLRRLKPDLIQGWMHHSSLAVQLAKPFYSQKIPILWSIHNSIHSLAYETKMTAAIMRFCAYISHLPAKLIFVSRTSKNHHEALGYCTKNSCVISNGFDISSFIPSAEARVSVRTELGLAEDALIIGLVARFHPVKDHANFLQAASILARNYPDTHFLLVGAGVDTTNSILKQLLQKIDLSQQLHLLGERHDMPRLTAALDIASSSSYTEAFPMVVGEAMSCGVPCVVTHVGDSSWIVGNTGCVVPPSNPEALAKAWKELIDMGMQKRAELGQAARARVIEYFSLDSVVAQYEPLYENVLSQSLNLKVCS